MSLKFAFYLAFLLFGVCYGFFNLRTLRYPFRSIPFYLLFILISELIAKLLSQQEANNMALYHILIPCQLIFYTWMYTKILVDSNRIKVIFYALSVSFVMLSILNSIFLQNHQMFPSNSLLLICLFVLSNSLFWFKSIITSPNPLPFNHQPEFWFNIGNLFFYSITFFVFGFYNYIAAPHSWIYHLIWLANIGMYACYINSIYTAGNLTKSS